MILPYMYPKVLCLTRKKVELSPRRLETRKRPSCRTMASLLVAHRLRALYSGTQHWRGAVMLSYWQMLQLLVVAEQPLVLTLKMLLTRTRQWARKLQDGSALNLCSRWQSRRLRICKKVFSVYVAGDRVQLINSDLCYSKYISFVDFSCYL